MKLIIAIVNRDDSTDLIHRLSKAGFMSTRLSTTGGFLRVGNITLLIGTDEAKVPQVIEIMREDHSIYHHGFSCGELRRIMNRRSWPEFVDRKGLRRLLLQILDLAEQNLRSRGLGEEKYLLPLYDRADTLTSPGRVVADALDRGETMRTMTLQYARPD